MKGYGPYLSLEARRNSKQVKSSMKMDKCHLGRGSVIQKEKNELCIPTFHNRPALNKSTHGFNCCDK